LPWALGVLGKRRAGNPTLSCIRVIIVLPFAAQFRERMRVIEDQKGDGLR
jgi:hypothetical protein